MQLNFSRIKIKGFVCLFNNIERKKVFVIENKSHFHHHSILFMYQQT